MFCNGDIDDIDVGTMPKDCTCCAEATAAISGFDDYEDY